MKVYFGFDTSNYTTSFAAVDEAGIVLVNAKQRLKVRNGERGLRQSEAVFQHTAAGDFIETSVKDFFIKYPQAVVDAVGYSSKPRDIEGSYMPCFLVGSTIAKCIGASMRIPCFPFSHQAGHVAAALISSGSTDLCGKEFAAFHVSGGTTDILHIRGFENGTFLIDQIGGTLDLNAGQVIDRAGVMMGLDFPAGAELEKLALNYKGEIPSYKPSVNGLNCNLSGIENKAQKLYKESSDKEKTSAYVIKAIGDTLAALTDNLTAEHPDIPIVYAGGVMSCEILHTRLGMYSSRFAAPELSSDNAAGIAYLTMLSSK